MVDMQISLEGEKFARQAAAAVAGVGVGGEQRLAFPMVHYGTTRLPHIGHKLGGGGGAWRPHVPGTWHPHVYSTPPKAVTSHLIDDILGTGRAAAAAGIRATVTPAEQPLNLTVKERLLSEEEGSAMKRRLEDAGGADAETKKKKMRTTFTGKQIYELEKMFETKKYLNSNERSDMSRLLNVTEQQVKIWFQNRRTKWKKQEHITNEEAAQILKSKTGRLAGPHARQEEASPPPFLAAAGEKFAISPPPPSVTGGPVPPTSPPDLGQTGSLSMPVIESVTEEEEDAAADGRDVERAADAYSAANSPGDSSSDDNLLVIDDSGQEEDGEEEKTAS